MLAGKPGLAGKQRVRRQAVVAAVDLGGGEENRFLLRSAQGCLGQCRRVLQIRGQYGGGVGQDAEHIGQETDFLLHAVEQGAGGLGGVFQADRDNA
ncbi:hypothetical protein D3C73_1383820 [compost metagenome]